MASVASHLTKVNANAQSDSLEDAREICADGTCFPSDLRNYKRDRSFVKLREDSGRNFEFSGGEMPFGVIG